MYILKDAVSLVNWASRNRVSRGLSFCVIKKFLESIKQGRDWQRETKLFKIWKLIAKAFFFQGLLKFFIKYPRFFCPLFHYRLRRLSIWLNRKQNFSGAGNNTSSGFRAFSQNKLGEWATSPNNIPSHVFGNPVKDMFIRSAHLTIFDNEIIAFWSWLTDFAIHVIDYVFSPSFFSIVTLCPYRN